MSSPFARRVVSIGDGAEIFSLTFPALYWRALPAKRLVRFEHDYCLITMAVDAPAVCIPAPICTDVDQPAVSPGMTGNQLALFAPPVRVGV